MLSPQKFMSPFDCNMAIDSGYKVVLPYDGVAVGDVGALVQDAIFSRPPKACTGVFIGGKDITLALDMMAAARAAMVPPFQVSVFADPGGSFTTAAAMVTLVERALERNFGRALKGLRISVFGAMGVVGFASAVIAALEGAKVRVVAHDTIEPLMALAAFAKTRFGATLEPVAGQAEALKARILDVSDVAVTAGPAGVNILPRRLIARAPGLLVAADVNAVAPYGIEGMELFMDGAPLPGCSTLGVGALAIGDVKYKTQAGLFRRMLTAAQPLDLDFRDAFTLAREIVSEGQRRSVKGKARAAA
nr:methylene-tetrahydromethanopterin dehydrogenase N-terminal domain-containing protein [Hyphomicrobium sp.]